MNRKTIRYKELRLQLVPCVAEKPEFYGDQCNGSTRAVEIAAAMIADQTRENFVAIMLDAKNSVIAAHLVSVGNLNTTLVHPREVFRPAIAIGAASIIVAHNHPSGDPDPSPEDIEITRRLRAAGLIVGIKLIDHIVIGDGRFVSMASQIGWTDLGKANE